MKIILTKDIRKLGRTGDIVDVSEGFARNYLLRNELAQIATAKAVDRANELRDRQNKNQQATAKARHGFLKKVTSQVFEFSLAGDKNGHLYAGLKESEILARITEGAPALSDTLKLANYTPIKTTGEHTVLLQGLDKQQVSLKLNIKILT